MVVNNHAQYCSIAKTGIGKARMVIGGEVDAGKLATLFKEGDYMLMLLVSLGLQTRRQGSPDKLG